MGEAISRATHAGDPGAGEVFITGWSRVADALDDAATAGGTGMDNLPETWSSQLSTPVVRAHLLGYQEALAGSAHGLAGWRVRPTSTLVMDPGPPGHSLAAGVRRTQSADTADVAG